MSLLRLFSMAITQGQTHRIVYTSPRENQEYGFFLMANIARDVFGDAEECL